MSTPKRQHWVPRFYLRHFAIPDSKQRDRVWIFHRKEGEPTLTNINNIAVEKHLYSPKLPDGSRDPELEKKLAKLEDVISNLWPGLAAGFVDLGSEGIRKIIGLYLSLQFLRHPNRRESLRNVRKRLIEEVEKMPADKNGNPAIDEITIGGKAYKFDNTDWDSYRGAEFNDSAWHALIGEEAIKYAEMLMSKRWSVLFIDAPLFITSDHPLYVVEPEFTSDQIGGKGASIAFPLSPTRLLWMDNLNEPQNQYYHLNNNQADLYNYFTWVNTDSFMISPRNIDEVLTGLERIRQEYEGPSPNNIRDNK